MRNIRRVRYAHLNNRILTIKWRANGSRLPSAEEVLIIRPTGKTGQGAFAFQQGTTSPGALPGSQAFQSRIWTQSGPDGMQLLLSVKEYVPRKSYFPKIQAAILIKKILLTVVRGVGWGGEPKSPTAPAREKRAPPPAQAAGGQRAAPVIKDPAEYNAYVGAVQQKDPTAKISGLEAFLTQYPNSVMKNQALEILMGAYQQAGNQQKTTDTAVKLVTADPCNVRALALLAYFYRLRAQGGDPNANQLLADAKKYAHP